MRSPRPAGIVECRTLVDVCRLRAADAPDRATYTFLRDGETEDGALTNAALDRAARAIAAVLAERTARGARALLLYPPGLEFIAAYFGCLYAGVLAVPVYPPNPARLARTLPRLLAIAADARPAVALTTASIAAALGAVPELAWLPAVATDVIPAAAAAGWRDPGIGPDDVAFLQYTSGSTAAPKGVVVTHRNLLHNQAVIRDAFGYRPEWVSVNWLPIYHDMGLIGQVLHPLYVGARCVLMSPFAFLKKPVRWLDAITRCRATVSTGPNFAYDLCVRRIPPEERVRLDLGSWTVALNGSEPIAIETLERFARAFAPHGFRWEAFYPCYGLAEATLCVSGGHTTAAPRVAPVSAEPLAAHRVREAADPDDAVRLVGSGRPGLGLEVAIVDPATCRRVGPGVVGEIWVAGDSVAAGYWERPGDTARTFHAVMADTGEGPFLRTGDLGFLRDGQLFVTGRLKDVVIVRGRNHYPQDLERAAERSHAALRPGCGAAFSVPWGGEERLVLVYELGRDDEPRDLDEVANAIRRAVVVGHDIQVHSVVLLRPGALPKTSSGKVQRRACLDLFLRGGLDLVGEWRTGVLPPAARAGMAEARAEVA
jgi:acyl-CoA synthetase (AMP-forming)/AMP-acid ligase II